MTRGVSVLGSTGSIGTGALEVIESLASDYRVVGLAAGNRWQLLADQACRFHPGSIALASAEHRDELRAALNGDTELLEGPDAVERLATLPEADVVISAIVGAAGLPATIAAARAGKDIALANKESLVVAGAILMPVIKETGARLLPIDSEHSAVFQAMRAGHPNEVRKIYLTASGGPFRTWSVQRMQQATLDDALNHPTWNMGRKITIDSATMMNKALEIIEAHWLFDLDPERIEIVVHPESIVHSMVEFCDGSIVAQLGSPDMRTPIQYALTFPERRPCCSRPLDIMGLRQLNFEEPDRSRFPAIDLGYEAARLGGTAGAVLNAANEAAVEEFCGGRIAFTDIVRLNAQVLSRHQTMTAPTLSDVLDADQWARNEVRACLQSTPS